MGNPERRDLPPEEDYEKAAELAWLKLNRQAFFAYVQDHYAANGRGALVIDTTAEPLGDETPFYYVDQARFEAEEDEVSRRMATLIEEYDPEAGFVAVFIRPGIEFEFSMYQIRVGEDLVQAINTPTRELPLTRLNVELSHLTQLVGESDQIIEEDIEEAKRKVNGNKGFNLDF